jgi:hypothetical protein
LTTSDNDIVNQWLDHLDEIQPADGRFTEDVLAGAGKFPIDRPPGDAYDNRNDREKSYQYSRGTAARAYAREMATFRATMAAAEAAKVNSEGAENYRLKSRYWSQIADWLDRII